MSLAISPSFPAVDGISLIVGTAYSELSAFIIQRPVFGAVWKKAQWAHHPKEVVESKEAQTAAASLLTSASSSLLQSYGVNALLHLANVTSYKGAAIIGTLILAAQSAPQIVQGIFVSKQPIDVIASSLAVKLLDTVGLSLALQAYNQHFGNSFISDVKQFK